ncbi:hypothetical protein Rhopal_006344-T1 [Rhodotorula paludigena]|uniref:Glycosyl transferase CAP10 domain-containing protein n=1 Tax=Rhodotorula paludigena TaxID=86838 RepID=A0AAV5GVC7_9BASI|nr:hypothetical protein Rhopal_006344-T1 [Rhodotorula paludigena]
MVSLRDMYRRPLILSAVLVACGVLAILRSSPRSYILVPDRRGGTEKAQVLLPADYYARTPSDHFRDHVDHLFAPWQCLADADDSSFCKKPITSKSLSALEWLAKGGAYRIRFTGTDILYRPLTVFGQTYKKQRLEWIMNTIRDMSDAGMLTRTVNGKPEPVRFDAVFRTGDGPEIAKDTLSKDSGYVLFSCRTSPLHLDIPIPDPPAYGSNGNYVWPPRSELVPWAEKIDKLVFRGAVSFNFGVDNWQSNPRIRLAQLASKHPHLIDAGMTTLRPRPLPPLTGPEPIEGQAFFPVPSPSLVQSMSNFTEGSKLSMREQSGFKYVLDLDGGLGSSRRVSTLGSGSVPFFVESPWYGNFEPTLRPWVHYVPVSEFLTDLPAKIAWLQEHEEHAQFIVRHATAFADTYLSKQAVMEEFALMLSKYADLQGPDVDLDSSDVLTDFCETKQGRLRQNEH